MMGRIGHPPRTSRLDKTVENRYVNPIKINLFLSFTK